MVEVVKLLSPLLLEVMDKEPEIVTIWLIFVGLNCLALLLRCINRLLSLGVLSFLVYFAYDCIVELHLLEPYICAEAGEGYFWQTYAAIGVGALFCLTALFRPLNAARLQGPND